MKALSLWQPWATAIALGAKRIETRDWATSYRGPLAIHAAKRCVKSELEDMIVGDLVWESALWITVGSGRLDCPPWRWLPFGAVVAVCRLIGCARTESFAGSGFLDVDRGGWCERDMGDFYPGRWGWVLADVRAITPVPWRGAQGLFEIPDAVVAAAAL